MTRFQWGVVAKHSISPKDYYFAATLTEAQVNDLPGEDDGRTTRIRANTHFQIVPVPG